MCGGPNAAAHHIKPAGKKKNENETSRKNEYANPGSKPGIAAAAGQRIRDMPAAEYFSRDFFCTEGIRAIRPDRSQVRQENTRKAKRVNKLDRRRMPAKAKLAMGEGNMTQASYDIIIPGSVRQDKRLSPHEQLLYGEIRGLCKLSGFCWASNTFLAERLQSKKRAVIRWIQKLEKCGHVTVEHGGEENKNLRKIILTEGVSHRTPPVSRKTPPVSAVVSQGVSRRTLPPAGIRKNTLKTSTSSKSDGGDDVNFSKIPKKISQRFDSQKPLREFYANCGGDTGLMQRYLDHAEKAKAKNPTGLAIRLAQERGVHGPPGGDHSAGCSFCVEPSVSQAVYNGKKIRFCPVHQEEYRKLKETRKHLEMLESAAAG